MQKMLDGMQILNNNDRVRFLEPLEHIHPAVVVNPVTGHKCLFVDPTTPRISSACPRRRATRSTASYANTSTRPNSMSACAGSRVTVRSGISKQPSIAGVDNFKGPRKLQRHTVDGAPLIPASS